MKNILTSIDVAKIWAYQRKFAEDRDWDQFHSPKNLAMALSVETSELCEIFQWLGEEQSQQIMSDPLKAKKVKDEVADILFYLLRFADRLDLDVESAFWEKAKENEQKYPIEKSKGNANKYKDWI